MSDINQIRNDLLSNIDAKKGMKVVKGLRDLLKNSDIPFKDAYDLVGEVIQKDSDYFMDKIYQSVQIQLRKFSLSKLIEMDEYILKNFCFLEDEDIIATFYGTIFDKKTSTVGRIFLTNYRIILSGKQEVRSAQKSMRVGRPSLIGMAVGAAIRSGFTAHRKAIRRAITLALRKDITAWNLAEWGYYFPLHNAMGINRTKKNISYSITIETEKKPITFKITIVPLRVKTQNKQEFAEQKDYILSQIEQLLKKYQQEFIAV